MLGVLRWEVNEGGTPMDAGKGKSRDFRLSQALAYPVVKKGVCGDFILCGLSPPVSPRREMVNQYTLLTTSGCTKILGSTCFRSLWKHAASRRANCGLTLYENLQISAWSRRAQVRPR